MKSPSSVVTLFAGGVFRVRLSRPRVHNAFDEEMVKALHAALDAAEGEASARLLLLEAEGKSFCAGADLAWMHRQGGASFEENEISSLRLARLFDRLDTMAMPVIARVQGPAVGGGVGLVAASDVAVASSEATFSLA
ncbi:MAG TPA: enoyl-CoA hydratase-related protein, partial [Planctomycetota bacterium]|nr:enoyl-CoA hydratase-related protein [Planctomycetota bacterium]